MAIRRRPRPAGGRSCLIQSWFTVAAFLVCTLMHGGSDGWEVVPEAGLEPAHPRGRGILNPLRLPISPLWHGRDRGKLHHRQAAQYKQVGGVIPYPGTGILATLSRSCR